MKPSLDEVRYYLDNCHNVWKGPIFGDNLKYAKFHGWNFVVWEIWVLERSDPDPNWAGISVGKAHTFMWPKYTPGKEE